MTAAATPGRAGAGLGWLAYQQWLGWPGRLLQASPGWRGIAGDGHFLLTLPMVALLAPVLVVGLAFVVGVSGVGYETVYTESVLFLAVAVGVGTVSSHLGALGLAAFVVGDVIRTVAAGGPGLADGPGDLVGGWLPLLITYLLLASVVVILPRAIRGIVASVGSRRTVSRRLPVAVAWPVSGGLVVLLTWLAITAWVAAAPTLIRPVFTWADRQPTVEAVATLQETGNVIVATAIATAIARHVWIGITLVPGPWRERVRAAEQLFVAQHRRFDGPAADAEAAGAGAAGDTAGAGVGGRRTRRAAEGPGGGARSGPSETSRTLVDVLAAGLATLALAGILLTAWVWVACFVVFLGVRILRSDRVGWGWLDAWKRLAARAPAWIRLLALFLLSRLAVDASSTTFISSYTELALLVLAAVLVAFVVFPGTPSRGGADDGEAEGGRSTTPPGARGGPAAAAHALTWAIALVTTWSWATAQPAAADNCGSFSDCFNQLNTATEAALGLSLLAIVSLVIDFTPAGTPKGVIEAVTGRDLLTGEELAWWERALGVLPVVGGLGRVGGTAMRYGDDIVGLGRPADDIAGAGRHGDELADVGGGGGRSFDEAAGATGRSGDDATPPTTIARDGDEALPGGGRGDDDPPGGGRGGDPPPEEPNPNPFGKPRPETPLEALADPSALAGRTDADMRDVFSGPGWSEAPTRGSSGGTKWYHEESGVYVQFSDGASRRHFVDDAGDGAPYWKITVSNAEPSGIWIGPDGAMYSEAPKKVNGVWTEGTLMPGGFDLPPRVSEILGGAR